MELNDGLAEINAGTNADSASPIPPTRKRFFEDIIAASWQKSAQGIFDTSSALLAAKRELGLDVFKTLQLPFGVRTRDRLIKIANCPVLATHVSQCPPHWGTLYALAQVSDKVLLAKFRDGTISPSLERKDIRSKVLGLSPNKSGSNESELNEPNDTAAVLAAILADKANDKMITAAFDAQGLEWFLGLMPAGWLAEMEARVTKHRTRQNSGGRAEPHLKASEMLRRAMSLVKIAGTPPITPAVAASNEKEALNILHMLNTVLATFDVDEITIVRQHAKENRCEMSRSQQRQQQRRAA